MTKKSPLPVVVLLGMLVIAGAGITRMALRPKPTLWEAAAAGDVETVAEWIARGKDVNEPGLTGFTPLHFACGPKGGVEVAKYLLEAGADPNAVGPGNETPLMRAKMWQLAETEKLLREAGAK